MSLQDTILDLYRQEKLDKAAAFRLLQEAQRQAPPPVAEPAPAALEAEVPLAGDEDTLLALWAYFLHLIAGQEETLLEVHGSRGPRRLTLRLEPETSFADLRAMGAAAAFLGEASAPHGFIGADQPVDAAAFKAWARICPGGLRLGARPDVLGATRFEAWGETLQQLLREMEASPAAPLRTLDHLPESHKRMLEGYNRTHAYLPPHPTLPGLLDPVLEHLQHTPAVLTSTGSLSYGDLKALAYPLGHLLRRLGARPNQLIPVLCRRSAAMPALLYGVAQSGAAYVPLEPHYPEARVLGIFQETGARILVTDAATLHEDRFDLAASPLEAIVCLDSWPHRRHRGIRVWDARALGRCPATAPEPVNAPEDLCYVIFTSGSTGKPKGVMISHLNLVNTLVGVNATFGVHTGDRVLCFSSYGFDLSVWDIFGSFLAGAAVFVPSAAEIKHPQALMGILAKHRITIWDSVPTGMSQLLMPFLEQDQGPVLSELRLAMLSGEFIPLALPAQVHRFFPHCKVSSLGGATEGTVWSIFHHPVEIVEPHWKSIPYGRPLPNQRFHVLNEALRPCAVGQKGMLYIGGLGVAQGYYRDEDKTRAAFLPDPWHPGQTLYRTGDLGRFRAEGVIEILGRADFQVKVRGFRVELGEVESQLSAMPGLDQCAVLARKEEGDGSLRLEAFYTRAQGELPAGELRDWLAARLPEYMLPSRYIHLAAAPVNASGKLDRKALAEYQPTRGDMGQSYAAPQTEVEQALAEALKRILKLDQVGVDDHFFLVGGDSLLSLQYLSVLRQLGFAASPDHIRRAPTIRGLLALLAQEGPLSAQTPPPDRFAPGPMPGKFLQRMPLVDRDHWNQSLVVRFHGLPDLPRLERALQALTDHHRMLRIRLDQEELVVGEGTHPLLPFHDLSRVPFFLRPARFRRLVLDLQTGGGLAGGIHRAMVVKLTPQDVRLVWAAHHLAVDAHCWRILLEDLIAAYQEPELPLLGSGDYASYVQGVGRRLASEPLPARPPAEPLRLPKDHPQGGNPEGAQRRLGLRLSQAQTGSLLALVQRRPGLSLHLLLLTAVSEALAVWTGGSRVAMDVISHGRDAVPGEDFSRTIGWFATHNPFSVELPEGQGGLAAVQAAWEAHQAESALFVARCNQAAADPGHPWHGLEEQPVLYNFLGDFDTLSLPAGWQVLGSAGQDRGPDNLRTHALEIEAYVQGGRLQVQLLFGGNQFRPGSIRTFRRHLESALALFHGVVPAETSPDVPGPLEAEPG